jgi:hypothetical protein
MGPVPENSVFLNTVFQTRYEALLCPCVIAGHHQRKLVQIIDLLGKYATEVLRGGVFICRSLSWSVCLRTSHLVSKPLYLG